MNNEAAIRRAANQGGADQVLNELHGDIDAFLGPTFGGRDLSGGQWQKVATSRSFFKKSKLVILDEPSASLDPQAESDLYDKYVKLSEGKTVIFISHRLGIAKLADRVIVMKQGQIVEEGTHEVLMNHQGHYYTMWKTQASLYQKEVSRT